MSENNFNKFEQIYLQFYTFVVRTTAPDIWQEEPNFNADQLALKENLQILICAFNRALSGRKHPQYNQALEYLQMSSPNSMVSDLREFLLDGLARIRNEVQHAIATDPEFSERLDGVFRWLQQSKKEKEIKESIKKFWTVFFPEGLGILENRAEAENRLRQQRSVQINMFNNNPLKDPATQILFTANVLLTVPLPQEKINALPVSSNIKTVLMQNERQRQKYWYDHPLPVGTAPENNEILYGLRGLNEMMAFEKDRGIVKENQKLTVVLSCSVTHPFLYSIAKVYLKETIEHYGGFEHLNVYLFTEHNAQSIVKQILIPAYRHFARENSEEISFNMFGVEGEYGRHYSFLKALAALWQVLIDPQKKATFKIDLDQIFDEEHLVSETGNSALEHFTTALWGAQGVDAEQRPVYLGMIAGALVNAADIEKSLFTPDVPYPPQPKEADDFVFFSKLPQALSTQAEMMARYNSSELNGKTRCLQRIHVTGGTNGVLIDALRRFKPFVPSFIGRAEDQAYLLSTMTSQGVQLAYLHKPGLIMRHDKELFATDVINASEIGKMIGDYERILYFSAYARVLTDDYKTIKQRVDPFTGCFISAIPKTVVYLRFVFKLLSFLQKNEVNAAQEFLKIGIPRLRKTMVFCQGENSLLKQSYLHERAEWDAYYRTLSALEDALLKEDQDAMELKLKANKLIGQTKIN